MQVHIIKFLSYIHLRYSVRSPFKGTLVEALKQILYSIPQRVLLPTFETEFVKGIIEDNLIRGNLLLVKKQIYLENML